jgi:maltose alpha-D-glucosyltransferase/alpha-amylase
MLGEVSRRGGDGGHFTLMLLQRFLHNQGDGWQWTLSILERAAQDASLPALDAAGAPAAGAITPLHEFEAFVTTLGRRLGEMHSVLARPGSEPAFAPEAADEAMLARWGQGAVAQLDAAFEVLQAAHEFSADAAAQAQALLGQRKALAPGPAAAGGGRRRRAGHPHPRRLPPGPGAGVVRRRLDRRL